MKNILLVLISFVIIGCYTVSPVTNKVDLTAVEFKNTRDFKEEKACEIYFLCVSECISACPCKQRFMESFRKCTNN